MDRRLDPARDIDWEVDFTWVQRAPVLTVLERGAGWVHLRHPAGGEFTMSRVEAEADFFPVQNGAMLKPRYAPVKAHCAQAEAAVELPCGTVRLAAGDVLLNDDGRFRVVGSAVFDRDYVAIACPTGESAPRTASARA
jgi:hypothetical protein